ncbi:trans-acting enoyl reductase family protein [Nocardia sp. XZ_19_385]|uniref:saccharopine dehydrogenase family protein n=1 Tax=Nocardia sp. XZ_19_385 TaxID=2769488 RepID=UPI001890157F|nr:saccharopine dehydrogenase NADP-binding domain-containing protein [Nocardia sp. XZ_19_385]
MSNHTIAVYGASGFQGVLVLAELTRRNITTVLSGRDADKLKAAAAQAGMPDAELRVAAIDDHSALVAAFRDVNVVINCAGPFTPTGDRVIAAALAAGAHYADTCGEQPFLRHVYETYPAAAESAGVTVVPAATDGGIPGDLLAHLIGDRLGPLAELTSVHRFGGETAMSRGSLRTMLGIAEAMADGGVAYLDNAWRPGPFGALAPVTLPGEPEPVALAHFPLQEAISVPRHLAVRNVQGAVEESTRALFATPVTDEMIESLPVGPDDSQRAAGTWTIVLDAVAEDGRRARGIVSGPDTYGTTALTAVEAAVRLATTPPAAGVLAPAQAFDPADFLAALEPFGVRWTIEDQ